MTIYVSVDKENSVVQLMARAEGDGIIGDFVDEVRPGESAFGRTYDEWFKTKSPYILRAGPDPVPNRS